jgi:hypothetical protein
MCLVITVIVPTSNGRINTLKEMYPSLVERTISDNFSIFRVQERKDTPEKNAQPHHKDGK